MPVVKSIHGDHIGSYEAVQFTAKGQQPLCFLAQAWLRRLQCSILAALNLCISATSLPKTNSV
jgi:hypothetical protein